MLPAPGTKLGSRTNDRYTFTPSSMALSTSSKIFFVLPLKMMVLSLQSSVFLLKTINFSEASSSTQILSHYPA